MEITDILSDFGVPAGAVALAVGLVRGAGALEKDASEPALRYVSNLLIGGGMTNFGKVGATLIPATFDRIFGSRPLSAKFISCSFLATSLFWLILLEIRHPNWGYVWQNLVDNRNLYQVLIPAWYILDWCSLIKAKFLLKVITSRYSLLSTTGFVFLDIILSYIFAMAFTMFVFDPLVFFVDLPVGVIENINFIFGVIFDTMSQSFFTLTTLHPITGYFTQVLPLRLSDVIFPSTLLTSIWTFLLLGSSCITILLIPVDRLRRFTAWWFRDVDKRPLTALAKVAGTLIIICAVVIKAVRWVGA